MDMPHGHKLALAIVERMGWPLWCGPPSHRMFCATANLGQKKKNRKTLTLRMYKDQAFKPEWSQNELK